MGPLAKRLVLRKEESGRSFGVGRIGELKIWYWRMRVTARRQGVGTACGLGLIHENGIPDWQIASRGEGHQFRRFVYDCLGSGSGPGKVRGESLAGENHRRD